MGKHYDLTKPPKFISNILSEFRKWKLTRYKKKKVREDKRLGNKYYYLKFKVIIDDPINPQEMDKDFEMILPARASFFAKKRAENSIKDKLRLYFTDIESVSEEDLECFEESREQYVKEKGL